MEPITTTAITTFLIYLAKVGVNKAVETLGENSADGASKWLKSLFYKDEEPKIILEKLKVDPDSKKLQKNAVMLVENSIDGEPIYQDYLKQLIQSNKQIFINNSQKNTKNTKNTKTIKDIKAKGRSKVIISQKN